MKIYLEDKNKRKIVYDILNIFPNQASLIFTEDKNEADIRIKNGRGYIFGEEFFYRSNQDLKKILYDHMVDKTSYRSPWGTLTGSKPSKLLKNKDLREIKETYRVADEKLKLLKDVKNEQDRLIFDENSFSLYINIPFCPTRCDYCSYPTLIGAHHDKGAYVNYLIREIEEIRLPRNLDAIYIGGGTPSYLSAREIERVLEAINKNFTYKELTFEAGREDTLDFEKLDVLRAGGVSRISLNPQTFNRDVLQRLNRDIDMDHFFDIYRQAKDLGFIVNMDFIVGLVGESEKDFIKNFKVLEDLLPDNITFHALAIKSGSKYREQDLTREEDDSLGISRDIGDFTRRFSYRPYYLYRQKNIISNLENVGYRRKSTAQRYNILINEEIGSILGLGMNANSKLLNGKKFRNPRNLRDYYKDFEKNLAAKNEMIEELRR
ncbi:radical SAM protein [uncultured Anaerococcus sp.]|uniref:radical SAM protein n=1 Tax=uncultured Anaerococcus sp. TaxID=293428 RepID=UPI0025CD659B|nr:radical SAM protein [uncultured Anaerococcus sp.]